MSGAREQEAFMEGAKLRYPPESLEGRIIKFSHQSDRCHCACRDGARGTHDVFIVVLANFTLHGRCVVGISPRAPPEPTFFLSTKRFPTPDSRRILRISNHASPVVCRHNPFDGSALLQTSNPAIVLYSSTPLNSSFPCEVSFSSRQSWVKVAPVEKWRQYRSC